MQLKLKVSLFFNAVFLVLLAIGAVSYFQQKSDLARLGIELESGAKLIEQYEKQITVAQKKIEVIKINVEKKTKEIQKLRKKKLEPKEIIREIPTYIPLPSIPTLADLPVEGGEITAEKQGILFNPEQSSALRDFYLDCAKAKVELNGCGQTTIQLRKQMDALRLEVGEMTRQRNEAVNTAKGGSVWTRIKRHAKTAAVAGAVGIVTGAVLSH